MLASAVKTLQNSGVESVYVVAGLADLYMNGGPVVVVSLKSGSDTKAVAAMLQGVAQTMAMAGGKEWLPDKIAVHPHGTNTILVGAESVVARYEKLTMSKRDDLVRNHRETGDGWRRCGGRILAGARFSARDSRALADAAGADDAAER